MNIVEVSNSFKIYGDEINTLDSLPVATYDVNFSPMSGFSLIKRDDMLIKENKIYGCSESKVNKVLNSFELSDRNMGVILSGSKGIGKTLFAKLLARESIKRGLPMIIVSEEYSGISSFLSSIEQEVVVLFDEFEKIYESDTQESLLSLFDGTDNGKKLFIVTCNKVGGLNEFFINRPGRFHYHIKLNKPTKDEVREYLTDNLKKEYHKYIDNVVFMSDLGEFTYDSLRAIAFELNQGTEIKEAIEDLNVDLYDYYPITVVVKTKGDIEFFKSTNLRINSGGNFSEWMDCKDSKYDSNLSVSFPISEIKMINGTLSIPLDCIDTHLDSDNIWSDNENMKEVEQENLKVTSVQLLITSERKKGLTLTNFLV